MLRPPLVAAASVGVLAFGLYRTTMLPGMDFGDTGSFQARVGTALLTPRDGYPLYTAIGTAFHWLAGGDAARALNLASTTQGALACAAIVLLGAELTGSSAAAIAAATLFAASYTFWSQAIIAEVYALHILLVVLVLLAALRWERQPTAGRLAVVFAVYAVSFGNHLSMVLLAPGLIVFLLAAAPGGWRAMAAPRVLAMAFGLALLGALQYGWNLSTLWRLPDPPGSLGEALGRFWFDVTKADWRETMVLEVPRAMLGDHAAMYAFDLRQQFGWPVPVVAAIGLIGLARTSRRRAALLAAVYLAASLFAFGYNVGDKHVFYLTSHLIVALLAASGLVVAGSALGHRDAAAVLMIAYAAVRCWNDFPALDRSEDERPVRVIASLTQGLDDRHSVLLTDMNWQVQNGLSYFGKEMAPEVAYARMPAVLLYAPAFVADNFAIDRAVALNERARATLTAAYGPLLPTVLDPRVNEASLTEAVQGLPAGTRYVLCILKPTRDLPLDWNDVGGALSAAAAGRAIRVPDGDYVAIAGTVGRPPDFVFGSNRPFRRAFQIDGVPALVRMDSWLSADTIRRMGFGHVVAARRHTLIVERGASFVAFDASGQPIRTAYASNIFAPQRRYLIRR